MQKESVHSDCEVGNACVVASRSDTVDSVAVTLEVTKSECVVSIGVSVNIFSVVASLDKVVVSVDGLVTVSVFVVSSLIVAFVEEVPSGNIGDVPSVISLEDVIFSVLGFVGTVTEGGKSMVDTFTLIQESVHSVVASVFELSTSKVGRVISSVATSVVTSIFNVVDSISFGSRVCVVRSISVSVLDAFVVVIASVVRTVLSVVKAVVIISVVESV